MDNPNVNLKFLQKVPDHREANEQTLLFDIGSCELHTIHGTFKAGVQSIYWMLKKSLNSACHIFHAS